VKRMIGAESSHLATIVIIIDSDKNHQCMILKKHRGASHVENNRILRYELSSNKILINCKKGKAVI
jgi:hypothetical protein